MLIYEKGKYTMSQLYKRKIFEHSASVHRKEENQRG